MSYYKFNLHTASSIKIATIFDSPCLDSPSLELDHARDGPEQAGWARNEVIMFAEVRGLTLDFVPHCARSMLFLEILLVTPGWTCFFGLDERLEVRVDEERCPCAIADVAEGVGTPLPRLRHLE